MHLIAVLDNRNSMMFHNRRQSRDRVLCAKIITLAGTSRLWINHYSVTLFKDFESTNRLCVDNHFLEKATSGEFCFAENILPDIDHIENIFLFKWNRSYPGDFFFNIDLSSWVLNRTEDFAGSSHEKITMEVYTRA